MKQISVQVPDHVAEAVSKLAISMNRSQSNLCASWIEESVVREIKRMQILKKIDELIEDTEGF